MQHRFFHEHQTEQKTLGATLSCVPPPPQTSSPSVSTTTLQRQPQPASKMQQRISTNSPLKASAAAPTHQRQQTPLTTPSPDSLSQNVLATPSLPSTGQPLPPITAMPVPSARLHPTIEQADGATVQVLPDGGAVMVTLGARVMQISPCGVRVTCSCNGRPMGAYNWASVPRDMGNPVALMFEIATKVKRRLLESTPKVDGVLLMLP